MSLKFPIQCGECKTFHYNIEKFLFISDDEKTPFCSDQCIQKYYQELINYLKDTLRPYAVQTKGAEQVKSSPAYLAHLLQSPDQVTKVSNEIGQDYYIFTKEFFVQNTYLTVISICFCYRSEPSFLLLTEIIEPDAIDLLLSETTEVKAGEVSMSLVKEADNLNLQELSDLEQKKSMFLSILLSLREDNDIELENFLQYEKFIDQTVNEPEEVLELLDESGDKVIVYIKTFEEVSGVGFIYFVISTVHTSKERYPKSEMILSFPSRSSAIYNYFIESGDSLHRNLKN